MQFLSVREKRVFSIGVNTNFNTQFFLPVDRARIHAKLLSMELPYEKLKKIAALLEIDLLVEPMPEVDLNLLHRCSKALPSEGRFNYHGHLSFICQRDFLKTGVEYCRYPADATVEQRVEALLMVL